MVMSMHRDPKIERASSGPDGLGTGTLKPDLALLLDALKSALALLDALKSALASTQYALKPQLVSINDARRYLGGVSRGKFYPDILPQLETVHIGKRHLVFVPSMDRLIEARKNKPKKPFAQAQELPGIVEARELRNFHQQRPESPPLETRNDTDPASPIAAGTLHSSRQRKRRREGA